MSEGGQSTTGAALQWARRIFGGDVSFDDLEAEAAALPVGAEGCAALETFQGARTPETDPKARGALYGLTLKPVCGNQNFTARSAESSRRPAPPVRHHSTEPHARVHPTHWLISTQAKARPRPRLAGAARGDGAWYARERRRADARLRGQGGPWHYRAARRGPSSGSRCTPTPAAATL